MHPVIKNIPGKLALLSVLLMSCAQAIAGNDWGAEVMRNMQQQQSRQTTTEGGINNPPRQQPGKQYGQQHGQINIRSFPPRSNNPWSFSRPARQSSRYSCAVENRIRDDMKETITDNRGNVYEGSFPPLVNQHMVNQHGGGRGSGAGQYTRGIEPRYGMQPLPGHGAGAYGPYSGGFLQGRPLTGFPGGFPGGYPGGLPGGLPGIGSPYGQSLAPWLY